MLNTGGERDRMIAAQTTTVARRLTNHATTKRRELGAVAAMAESTGSMGEGGEGATTLLSPLSASTSGSRGMPSPCASLAAGESLVLILFFDWFIAHFKSIKNRSRNNRSCDSNYWKIEHKNKKWPNARP